MAFFYSNQTNLLFIIVLLIFVGKGQAQTRGNRPISKIQFEGLKKTKATYLQRFLTSKKGMDANPTIFAQDVQQLKNLYPIADASYRIDTLPNALNLVFEIKESLTLFPIVNFGGVEGNVWFQLGFTDVNWLGKGMQMTAFYQNIDSRHNFSIYYRIPYWRGSRWGSSFSLLRFASTEPLFFDEGVVYYDYDNTSVGATGIYEINRSHFIELGGTYFVEKYRKAEEQDWPDTPGPDQLTQPKFLLKLIHQIQRIDYHFFYQQGFDLTTNLQTVYNLPENDWFHIQITDFRFFQRMAKSGNLAIRVRAGISTNSNSPFAPFVLDSHVNIRGSGNRIDRGTATLILNSEYRQTVYDLNNFAAQVVAFSDLGTWRNPGGGLDDLIDENNLRHFIGGGFRIIYKKAYNAIFRMDYGIDVRDTRQKGLVIGLGQYF